MKNSKPYKYNAKDRMQKTPHIHLKKRKKEEKKEIEKDNTIKIDEERLNDTKQLDHSFLEGRVDSKESKKKEKVKRKVDRTKTIARIRLFRNIFLSLSLVCILILLGLYTYDFIKNRMDEYNKNNSSEVVNDKKIDDNYLFVGDYHTKELFNESFKLDYHYVNNGKDSYTSSQLLYNMKEDIYKYNPSIVFIEIGLYDINSNVSLEEYINNMKEIIYGIQRNRPYTEIYIESIYPINSSDPYYSSSSLSEEVNNETIRKYNTSLKKLTSEHNVHYLDVYSQLVDSKNTLDLNNTSNGYSLNTIGYQKIYKLIQKVVG